MAIKRSARRDMANSWRRHFDEMWSLSLLPFVLWLLCCSFLASESSMMGQEAWLRPGCHKVGNTRKISIPNCVEFTITTNACRGFCESYAVPSIPSAVSGLFRPPKPVVSVGQCCNMMKSEEIQRRVLCMEGVRNVTFKSAISCSCYHCKKD
ncbi:thyrostimulin alpha-2 subunit [Drosophila sulfurigaster albostrigata]|uniref:thyrostimulin alpha-2 subunit n=1 Tax=Drosophila sulfurigaster albostrigata TaxID=89887 RepID=UPI002D21B6A9|nr:thyrostimulin alpha-2 subunit [Drosophila sulfurigaster albostrigata]